MRQILAAGCVVLLLGAPLSLPVLFQEQARPSLLSIGSRLPPGVLISFAGDSVHFKPFFEKKTLLMFFSTSCPHCVRELENMRRIEEEFGDSLFVAAVGLNEKDAIAQLKEGQGLPTHLFLDPYRVYARLCGVAAVPAIFFVEEAGRVCYRRIGEAPIAADRQLVREFLAGGGPRIAKAAQ